jgi:thiamine biosynthesis protein ThiI
LNRSRQHITIRFHEIALKRGNRGFFIKKLMDNISKATKNLGVDAVYRDYLTVMLRLRDDTSWPALKERLAEVFGIAKFSLTHTLPPSIESIEELLASELEKVSFETFRITARRVDKRFPFTSIQMNRRFGDAVRVKTGAKVQLTNPDLEIFIEVRPGKSLVYFEEFQGPGGLPVGTGGRVLSLMSGGIDSPVASWRMMKRGCDVTFAHFHSFPLVDGSSREKAVELVELLTRFQFQSRLFLVPFADLQKEVILEVPPEYRVIVYRRFMLRIAEALAISEGAGALITGESLGQVGSQTLSNLATIHSVTTLPIFTPLIGMDKRDIIDTSQSIGTYPISIMPDQDCCSLFVPRHPATRSNTLELERVESKLDVVGLVREAIEKVELRTFSS